MDEICYLIPQISSKNEYCDIVLIDGAPKETYCERTSIKLSEFYQANGVGLKPELVLNIRQEDYQNEEKIRYENIDYRVLRTYVSDKRNIELILTRWIYGDA
ncbi:MAG: hypothetical protein RR738_04835 [Anaerorhabdus sp.]|uniref:hypothetical protein n=1 Tax=Anaerorhabdus sp. TaxID=1872524 RepID=UPI002FCBE216